MAGDWSRFRGPDGSGVDTAKGYPTEFGGGKNIVWRSEVRPGKSSPVLTAKHVFLTGSDGTKLYTQCFDRKTGKLLWERAVDRSRDEIANKLNHPAAISPVTDGENVYVFFKDYGVLSYDGAGKLRWKTPLGPFVTSMGLGSSPIVAGNHIVIVADQLEGSFIAAFDTRKGEIRWKTPRDEAESWATPLLWERKGAAPTIVTTGRGLIGGHDLATGKRLWTQEGLSLAIVASPAVSGDTIFTFGYGSESTSPFSSRLEKLDKNKDGKLTQDEYGTDPFLHGIAKFNGNRDMVVTEDEWVEKQKAVVGPSRLAAIDLKGGKPRELWRYEKNFVGVIPSPLVYDGVVYVVRNGGILTTFDAATGDVLKAARLEGALSGYSASPVAADGKVFLPSEEGKVAVVKAGGKWETLAVNDLGEGCFATPALAEGHIYLRTEAALYRIGSAR